MAAMAIHKLQILNKRLLLNFSLFPPFCAATAQSSCNVCKTIIQKQMSAIGVVFKMSILIEYINKSPVALLRYRRLASGAAGAFFGCHWCSQKCDQNA